MRPFVEVDVDRNDDPTAKSGVKILRAWKETLVILIAGWASVILLFRETIYSALFQWGHSDTYSHCFVVFPVALYLAWEQRERLLNCAPSSNYWGLPILGIASVGWLLGNLSSVQFVQHTAIVAMLQLLVFTVAGWAVTRVLLFPLGFLSFAVPFGDEWVRPLQDYTAFFTVKALQLTGVPVFRSGWIIATPAHSWEVVEACSGVRYIISFVVLGCLFSYWTYRSWARRFGFVLFCFLGGIVANGLRAYGSVIIAHRLGGNHIVHGWIFFCVVVVLLFWVGLLWRDSTVSTKKVEIDRTANAQLSPARSLKGTILAAVAAIIVVGLAQLASELLWRPQLSSQQFVAVEPRVVKPWHIVEGSAGELNPHFPGADIRLSKTYAATDQPVQLYIAYYRGGQRRGVELISAGNALTTEESWRVVSSESRKAVVDGETISVNQLVLKGNGHARLVWSWYWFGGDLTSNRILGKILELKSLILREPKGSAIIAVSVEMESAEEPSEASATLQRFLNHLALSATMENRWQ